MPTDEARKLAEEILRAQGAPPYPSDELLGMIDAAFAPLLAERDRLREERDAALKRTEEAKRAATYWQADAHLRAQNEIARAARLREGRDE